MSALSSSGPFPRAVPRQRCRWDSPESLPFGRYCDSFSSSVPGSSLPTGLPAPAPVPPSAAAAPVAGAWYPVKVESRDTRSYAVAAGGPGGGSGSSATDAAFSAKWGGGGGGGGGKGGGDSSSSSAPHLFRVRYLGFDVTDLVPLEYLRPLSAAYKGYVEADEAAEEGGEGEGASSSSSSSAAMDPASSSSAAAGSKRVRGDDDDGGEDGGIHTLDAEPEPEAGRGGVGGWYDDGDEIEEEEETAGGEGVVSSAQRRPSGLPPKWWKRRYALWRRFDEGVSMADIAVPPTAAASSASFASASTVASPHRAADVETWYSVTPECAALHAASVCVLLAHGEDAREAEHRTMTAPSVAGSAAADPSAALPLPASAAAAALTLPLPALAPLRVLDLFSGVGGNAVAFARTPYVESVVAVEADARRCHAVSHNATVYSAPAAPAPAQPHQDGERPGSWRGTEPPVHLPVLGRRWTGTGEGEGSRTAMGDVVHGALGTRGVTVVEANVLDVLDALDGGSGSGMGIGASAAVPSSHVPVPHVLPSVIFAAPPWGGPSYQEAADAAHAGRYNLAAQMHIARGVRTAAAAGTDAAMAPAPAPAPGAVLPRGDILNGHQLLARLAALTVRAASVPVSSSSSATAPLSGAVCAVFLPRTTRGIDISTAFAAGLPARLLPLSDVTHVSAPLHSSEGSTVDAARRRRRSEKRRAKRIGVVGGFGSGAAEGEGGEGDDGEEEKASVLIEHQLVDGRPIGIVAYLHIPRG
jgi:hypothetical protein